MSKEYSADISEAIRTFLDEDDWIYTFSEEDGRFYFQVSYSDTIKFVLYNVQVKPSKYIVYLQSPISLSRDCHDEKQAQLQEFVNRANYGLILGNFELDVRDNELRYKCAVDCEDMVPSKAIVRNSIVVPGHTFHKYVKGVEAIIYNGASAQDAIEMCEEDN